MLEAEKNSEAGKKTGKKIKKQLQVYLNMIEKLKSKKNDVFKRILAHALKDLIKNHKITLRADKKKITTLSTQENKKFDLDWLRRSMDSSSRQALIQDLLSMTKDKLNENFNKNALIVQKNEIMRMIVWL